MTRAPNFGRFVGEAMAGPASDPTALPGVDESPRPSNGAPGRVAFAKCISGVWYEAVITIPAARFDPFAVMAAFERHYGSAKPAQGAPQVQVDTLPAHRRSSSPG